MIVWRMAAERGWSAISSAFFIVAAVEAHYVGRLERGKRRRPTPAYREAFRAVLGVAADADIGFDFKGDAGRTLTVRSQFL